MALPTALLVANRGEIAIRVCRAAAELGIRTVAVYSEDDALSLHARRADEKRALRGAGAAAYLDMGQILTLAGESGCDAIHPGYGFLSENAEFARRCAARGLQFVGPRPEILEIFGDKAQARSLAQRCGVPILPGTLGPTTLEEAKEFFSSLGDGGAMMIKALAGGGGRGMRTVLHADEIADAYRRCQSEARSSFGNAGVYVEEHLPRARHVEVQIVGDGSGAVTHLWERECSIQRRHQKLVEVAPSPSLTSTLRERLIVAAVRIANAVRHESLGTVEFLVDAAGGDDAAFAFIEANPRLQVEHTVTEEVTGVDLVKLQLQLAGGGLLADLAMLQDNVVTPRGFALQLRINTEFMDADGTAKPSAGTLTTFEVPSGPGLRVDSFGYGGYDTNPRFDSLLAKLIVHSPTGQFADVVAKACRALGEFRIEGVATNVGFLQQLLRHPDFSANRLHTGFVEENLSLLLATEGSNPRRHPSAQPAKARRAGGRAVSGDPLAVLYHGQPGGNGLEANGQSNALDPPAAGLLDLEEIVAPPNSVPVRASMPGTIVSVEVQVGETVQAGQPLLVMEAMKMEHLVRADKAGIVRLLAVAAGDTVLDGHPLAFLEEAGAQTVETPDRAEADLEHVRADLAEVQVRHALALDSARPNAVARRRKTGQRTARENVEDLCDSGSFVEYGPLAIAAQRQRRGLDDLIRQTPADGMIAGIGTVNRHLFDETRARCMIMAYDYTVLAGTQGVHNHRKKDRMFQIAQQLRLPVVFFTEGGGGRPGDTEGWGASGLDCWAFHYWGKLSGLVPLVGINSGRCFAGNASLLGCCDVVIATANSNIGMGGPAMIEGGGLGIFRPEEVGPMDVQVANGVVDIAVADEAEAVGVAKQYLSYFQGPVAEWKCADQRLLRGVVPENRLRVYEVRQAVATLADTGSALELRRHFGPGMVTALIRVEGRPLGVIANNPMHLAGAIDSDGADKAARFMQLCDAFDLPILFLCDTPGIMVGPEVEKTALVRHASRMFVVGASLTVPFFTIVLRKGYGLGAQTMAGGSFKAPLFAVSWPTGEFGGMGLEGAVKLGFRKELAAINNPADRRALFDKMVAEMYQVGKGLNAATYFELDDVIDPADSRRWIASALKSAPPPPSRTGKKRPCIDAW